MSDASIPFAVRVLVAMTEPLTHFTSAKSPIWWPFLVSALVVALAAFALKHGASRSAWREFRRRFLGRSLWLHQSAHADYRFYIVNVILNPFIVVPFVIGGATVAHLVEAALASAIGPVEASVLPLPAMVALYTVVFFIAYDFGRFLAHSLLHEIPLLWEFHKVHHSAEVLTPFTSFRVHPVDLLVMTCVPNLITGTVSGAAWYLAGGEIGFLTFYGLHAGIAVFNLIGNLRHWQVWISFGATLNRWLISPAHHQIHHSVEPRHVGKNRGFELAIWDRLCGTLYVPTDEEEAGFALGLGDGTDGQWHSVARLYVWPFAVAVRRVLATLRTVSRRLHGALSG